VFYPRQTHHFFERAESFSECHSSVPSSPRVPYPEAPPSHNPSSIYRITNTPSQFDSASLSLQDSLDLGMVNIHENESLMPRMERRESNRTPPPYREGHFYQDG
jgi:hypothetical protein